MSRLGEPAVERRLSRCIIGVWVSRGLFTAEPVRGASGQPDPAAAT
jgi:hypothetical protein